MEKLKLVQIAKVGDVRSHWSIVQPMIEIFTARLRCMSNALTFIKE